MPIDPLPHNVIAALIRREQQAMVGRMLRGVVHNVSGAVQMIRLPLDLLELRIGHVTQQQLGEKLASAQQGLNRLTDELAMLASKIVSAPRAVPDPLDFSYLVRDQLQFWRANAYFKHQIMLELDLAEGLPLLKIEAADLALAVNALLANAVESLDAAQKGHLAARTMRQDDSLVLEITDDGPGPSAEMAPRMFEPFSTDKGADHDGLGLFLAREVMKPWRGEVLWSDARPCTFSLVAPIDQP